jgi:hypothetical protein
VEPVAEANADKPEQPTASSSASGGSVSASADSSGDLLKDVDSSDFVLIQPTTASAPPARASTEQNPPEKVAAATAEAAATATTTSESTTSPARVVTAEATTEVTEVLAAAPEAPQEVSIQMSSFSGLEWKFFLCSNFVRTKCVWELNIGSKNQMQGRLRTMGQPSYPNTMLGSSAGQGSCTLVSDKADSGWKNIFGILIFAVNCKQCHHLHFIASFCPRLSVYIAVWTREVVEENYWSIALGSEQGWKENS